MKLWITAGGTGSAWEICKTAKQYFPEEIELYVSDINDRDKVAAATLADHFFKVPAVRDKGYEAHIKKLLSEEKIDLIIPLIPWEQTIFAPDNEEWKVLGINSAAPTMETAGHCNDKKKLYNLCRNLGIDTIRVYDKEEIHPEEHYFVKAIDGFGAMAAGVKDGESLLANGTRGLVVQEYCHGEEVTAEVYYDRKDTYFAVRERLETKNGVCTKARFPKDAVLEEKIADALRKLTGALPFPNVFNLQWIREGETWKLMDINLRLASGTGTSRAAGFQLVRAMLAHALGKEISPEWLRLAPEVKTVLRVYDEVVVRE